MLLFFREGHGAEKNSSRVRLLAALDGWRRLGCFSSGFAWLRRRTLRFFAPLILVAIITARFIAAWLVTTWFAGRQRWLLLAARRLDAAQGATQFFNFTLVGEFLALGHFHQFQHFVEMINHLFQRLGNFRGKCDGLTDSGSFCRTKISGLDPRFRTRRFGTTFRTPVALRFALKVKLRPGFRRVGFFHDRFRHRRFRRIGFVRSKVGGRFRMRFAKIAGGIALVMLCVFDGFGGGRAWLNGFRRRRNFFGHGFGSHRTRPTATATATTTTAIATGTARRGR